MKKNETNRANIVNDEISSYIKDQEAIANNYVMKCFTVTMMVYTVTFILNLIGIFVINQGLMRKAYIPSVIIYVIVWMVTRSISMSNKKMKYFILFSIILMFTITGVFITYHVVLVLLLPILYAVLYSSKPVMRYVYILTIISTIIIVYCGYYFGLCDANMVLLTKESMQAYVVNGQFVLTQINENPALNLLLFYIIPRCLIYLAFMFVCESLFQIINGSLEKAKLSAELEEAKEAAENANRAKSQFLANISHEIRTPVNAVLGMTEMIIRESGEDAIRKYAYDVKNSSVELLGLINDILDSSKIEAGKMEIVCVEYNIGSMIHDLYAMMNLKSKEKGLQLIFDIDPFMPSVFYGDDKRIKQILINLLTNAVKYTGEGMVMLKLTCKTEGENAFLSFCVKDTGIGIQEENIGEIYEKFSRFDLSKNRNVEGTGLGMNIVQQFLSLMGSKLQIKSEYGKGSEFSFELEQKIIDKKAIGDFRERLADASEQNQYRSGYVAPDAKIMVVDDYEINLKVFKGLLKDTQIQIVEAESGQKCLDLLRKQSFDLIFMDHMMPQMDGIETLQEIKKNHLCDGVPIIMLTANTIVGEKEKYLAKGFDDFLSKPIIPEKLDAMVLKYLPAKFIQTGNPEKDKQQNEPDIQEIDTKKTTKSLQMTVIEQIGERLPDINLETGMATCSGDADFYLELLSDFAELSIKEELVQYYADGDFKNYNIRVHGFKNSAYSIGAKALGDLAYEMEKMTAKSFPIEIEMVQKHLFGQYDRICRCYKEIVKK